MFINQYQKTNTQKRKWKGELNRHFTDKETQMANKYMKRH